MRVSKQKYKGLLKEIRQLVAQARHNVAKSINTELLITYWNMGRLIVEKEIQDKTEEPSSREMMMSKSNIPSGE